MRRRRRRRRSAMLIASMRSGRYFATSRRRHRAPFCQCGCNCHTLQRQASRISPCVMVIISLCPFVVCAEDGWTVVRLWGCHDGWSPHQSLGREYVLCVACRIEGTIRQMCADIEHMRRIMHVAWKTNPCNINRGDCCCLCHGCTVNTCGCVCVKMTFVHGKYAIAHVRYVEGVFNNNET